MILTDKEMKEIHSSTFGKGLQTFARGIESAVLEKLRQQKPVAVINKFGIYLESAGLNAPVGTKLYTAPVPAVPDGWKLVPVEPTEDMLWALYGFLVGQLSEPDYRRYRSMLSAAPAAPAVLDDVVKQRDELVRLCEFNEKTMGDLIKQRDELLAAFARFLDNHQECRDADDWVATMVSLDEYHAAQEVFDKVKGE